MDIDTCEARIADNLQSRLDDLRKLWTAYCDGDESRHANELGTFFEYGLCFDYVPPHTFSGQKEANFRYQLSWGGPADEFRFFVNPDLSCHRIEYWFLDWYDGAHRVLSDENESLLQEIWDWFRETQAVDAARERAEESAS